LTLAPSLPAVIAGLAGVATGVFVSAGDGEQLHRRRDAQDRGLRRPASTAFFYYVGGSLGAALPGLSGSVAAGLRASRWSWLCSWPRSLLAMMSGAGKPDLPTFAKATVGPRKLG